MQCPFCKFADSKVIDSRSAEDGSSVRRRRECFQCAKRFTTYEQVEEIPLMVVKKDNRREAFDRKKLLQGILKACEKCSIPMTKIENTIDLLEKELRNSLDQEITTKKIGEAVMNQLRKIDQVAYVRFASVYREFTDIDSFIHELNILIKNKNQQEEKNDN
jgi:transcriptional repressor NrdR